MIYLNARAIIERHSDRGLELLMQLRDRPGEPLSWEFPGGRLDEFEPILDGLAREVLEETGLQVTRVLDQPNRLVTASSQAKVESLTPFFVYQTLRGPVDSAGFYFRCQAEGSLTSAGDGATGHRWFTLAELGDMLANDQFDWLAKAAVAYYLKWHQSRA